MTSGRKRVASRKELHKELNRRQDKKILPDNIPSTKISDSGNMEPWTPGSYVALKALLSARLCSAIWGIINDCDETYNYWEPAHFLLYGKGLQTWEYSPAYALRSYTYLLLHVGPAHIYAQLLQSNKILVFFFIRCFLALVACGCEIYFYRGICKAFGANIGRVTLAISVFSAGMFISSTAFLPSSFAMYMTMLSMGAWFHQSYEFSIFTTAISTFLGWPFAALIGVPIAFDILVLKKRPKLFFKWCFISAFTILMPMIQIDYSYFGRFALAPLNIVLYNVFTSHGPDLYGTSPPSFYFVNGILNFNLAFPAALLSLPLIVICNRFSVIPSRKYSSVPLWLALSSLYLWLLIFVLQPHKEERFLFPIYPLIVLAAACTIDVTQKLYFAIFVNDKKNHYLHYTNWLSILLIVIMGTINVSRIVGQYQAYRAPFDTFLELNRQEQNGKFANLRSFNICYGREWHRFPSSFFLPNTNWNIKFIESDFRGQLPQPYAEVFNGTSIIPPNMNDMNKEETSRYVPLSQCHFIIDVDRSEETEREPRYSLKSSQWKIIYSIPFLENSKSSQVLRAFYVPFLTEKFCTYVDYVLLQSTKLINKNHPG